MPLYIFRCSCGRSQERLRSVGTRTADCECGASAERLDFYPTAIGGRARPPVAERPVSLRQYREASEQIAHEHSKAEESAQRVLPAPNLWGMAKREATRLQALGIKDAMDVKA